MDYFDHISDLVSDREEFDKVVYTPLDEAMEKLKEYWFNQDLGREIDKHLEGDIPEPFKEGSRFVIFRHLTTPNYEIHRFISIADAYGWNPIFGEYSADKFTSNNINKYYLGRMGFHFGYGKDGSQKIQYQNVIDFNSSNGKPISSIKTLWEQPLTDFHRELFNLMYPKFSSEEMFFDSSEWFHKHGGSAKEYYKKFLALFIRHGILFENFVLQDPQEMTFTNEYFLPAFFEVWKKFNRKPLIVALEPTDIEGDDFWLNYSGNLMDYVSKKLLK